MLELYISRGVPPEGFIIIAACKDDISKELSEECQEWFKALGSKEIDKVEERCAFAFICKSGRNEVYEKRALNKGDKAVVTHVFTK